MKRILFVTDTYYPDSSATTTLVRLTAEELARQGHRVDVYPAEISGNHFSYPDSFNGVTIFRAEGGSSIDNAPVNPSEVHHVMESQVKALSEILDAAKYDCVFSAAVAFEVNFLAHRAIKGRKCAWFPMSFDPYAFNPHISEKQRQEYVKRENDVLCDASRIFFLNEFSDDYKGSPFENKIEYFNLPCIRKIEPDKKKRVINFDNAHINCVFLGDFYYGVENTDFIFRLFEKFRPEIRLYTVGNLCDYRDTVEIWKKRLGDRYVCHERVSLEAAHNVMNDCDVLVSMGHDSANMCPSKVIDFISSGKAVLHISKIRNCCAKKYLERYPWKCFIWQGEELTDERVRTVEQFILDAKGKAGIPFATVHELYNDFTMKALTDKIVRVMK